MFDITIESSDYLPVKANQTDAGYDLKAKIDQPSKETSSILEALLKELQYTGSKNLREFHSPRLYLDGKLYAPFKGDSTVGLKDLETLQSSNKGYVILAPIVVYTHPGYSRKFLDRLQAVSNQIICGTGVTVADMALDIKGYQICPSEEIKIKPDCSDLPALFVLPRSGWAAKYQLSITNSPGLIDAGYRDEIKLIVENRSKDIHIITDKTKLAQLVPVTVKGDALNVVNEVTFSDRGANGLGSTGI